MALWGSKKTNEASESSEGASVAPPAGVSPEMVADIVAQALARAGIGAPQQQVTSSAEGDDSPEARQEARFQRLENTINNLTPYANAIETGIPATVRNQVVATLSEGEREIYTKYQHEVDAYMRGTSIEAKSNPQTHRKAISLVLGEHVQEVAQLTLQRAAAEDVPHLAIPSGLPPSMPTEPQLTETERAYVEGYDAYSRRGGTWNASSYKYYQSIPKGYLHDMIAHDRANNPAKQKKE